MIKVLHLKKCLFALLFFPLAMFSQNMVTGTVTDGVTGHPLAGANVIIKGTTTGTTSDFDGNFSLKVDDFPITLIFSSLGFETLEQTVNSSGQVNVTLQESATALDEIVISGLASSIKRSNLANAVSTVSSESLTGTTTGSTLDGALYGKLTGVNINAAGGAPGGQIAVRLRGISSLSGNNQPLFIVDGVYISNIQLTSGSSVASGANAGREEGGSNRVSDINPDDIESIEVLKGASAAAIYGTRANAGVVIITTKKGKAGETVIKFDQDVGFNTIQNYAGRRQFTSALVSSIYGPSEAALFDQAVANGKLFNYEKELYGETGLIVNSRLSLSGGTDKTKFYFNATRHDEEGIMKNTGYNRNSLRLNLDHKINDKLKVGLSSNYINSKADRGPVGNENNGGFSVGYNLALTTNDWEDLFPDEFGVYPDARFASANIIYNRDNIINSEDINRFIQGANIEYRAIEGDKFDLKFIANGGLDYFQAKNFVYIPETHQVQRSTTQGFLSNGNTQSLQLNYNAFAVLNYDAGNDINLSGQFGVSYLKNESDQVISQTTQLVPTQTNISQGLSFTTGQTLRDEEDFGLIGQGTLNWNDKIIATAGIRFDKSTLNGDPNKYYAFPKASLAINVANFDFWNIDDVNLFKLRFAYGETGSSGAFGSLYTPLGPTSNGGILGLALPGGGQAQIGNPNLEPETSQEIEYGIDLSFLDGRIGLELTGYKRDVNNLIYRNSSIPLTSGFSTEVRNDFDLSNTGVEIALNAVPVKSDKITWNTSLSLWKNEAKVEKLGIGEFAPGGEGFSLTFGSAYLREGENATSLGANIGGTPTIIGDAAPDYEMSWFNQINFLDNFDLTFLWHLKEGGDVLNLTKLLSDFGGVTPDLDDPNVIANPRFATSGAAGYIEDGSYIRLREVGLFYNIPFAKENNLFEKMRVGISGKNLITITDYTGYDPETSAFGPSGLSQGIEVAPFPSSKQFFFHLGITF